MEIGYKIEKPVIIAHLIHEPTKTVIPVYKPIGWFKRFMIRCCFGLKYEAIDNRMQSLTNK